MTTYFYNLKKKKIIYIYLVSVILGLQFKTTIVHQWILYSEWVPSEWESKQLIKTSQ